MTSVDKSGQLQTNRSQRVWGSKGPGFKSRQPDLLDRRLTFDRQRLIGARMSSSSTRVTSWSCESSAHASRRGSGGCLTLQDAASVCGDSCSGTCLTLVPERVPRVSGISCPSASVCFVSDPALRPNSVFVRTGFAPRFAPSWVQELVKGEREVGSRYDGVPPPPAPRSPRTCTTLFQNQGRPGWHTECVVTSLALLGRASISKGGFRTFDSPTLRPSERMQRRSGARSRASGRTVAGSWSRVRRCRSRLAP